MWILAGLLARAGGGQNFGGGGGGGAGGGGGGGVGYFGPGVLVVGAVGIVLVVVVGYPLWRWRHRGAAEALGDNAVLEEGQVLGRLPANVAPGADAVQLTIERAQALADLPKTVPGFAPEPFATAVERAYFAVHQALSQLDSGRVRHLVSPELGADLGRLVERVRARLGGRPMPVADVAVGQCILDAAWTGPGVALVGATLTVAVTAARQAGGVQGWERLIFVRQLDGAPAGPAAGAAPADRAEHCRACGAPFETDLSGACKYCGAELSALAGWTLVELIPAGHEEAGFGDWLSQELGHTGLAHGAGGLVQILGLMVDVFTGF